MSVTEINVRRTLPYAAQDLFELVSDVRGYPSFIPWVKTLAVSDEAQDGEAWSGVAEAVVGWRAFTERFATRVDVKRNERTVAVGLVSGPFKLLENFWRFEETAIGATDLDFRIRYQFQNPILHALAAANKQLAAERIMAAFLHEAQRRYPQVSAA